MSLPISPRRIAESVWRAGVAAVDSCRLVRQNLAFEGGAVSVAGRPHAGFDRVLVLGAGKAGAGMARGVEDAIGGRVPLSGWVNVPVGWVAGLEHITQFAGRPAGVNEPRPEGVAGTRRILELGREADARTLVLVLVSGGGSALLVDPVVSLEAKQAVTRLMASRGAPIEDLNAVRTRLSNVKGGGLARALAGAGAVEVLVISDVIGDPLAVIASGPTVVSSRADAADVLARYEADHSRWPDGVEAALSAPPPGGPVADVRHTLIGTNATAVEAAAEGARLLGIETVVLGHGRAGVAAEVGREWAERLRKPARDPLIFIDGGEPTVDLAGAAGKGGRNQELVLAAVERLWDAGPGWALLSGGTDGEDGPTDAAGAVADAEVVAAAQAAGLDPTAALAGHASYDFFAACGGLVKTGPTHTNVMDLRVGVRL